MLSEATLDKSKGQSFKKSTKGQESGPKDLPDLQAMVDMQDETESEGSNSDNSESAGEEVFVKTFIKLESKRKRRYFFNSDNLSQTGPEQEKRIEMQTEEEGAV